MVFGKNVLRVMRCNVVSCERKVRGGVGDLHCPTEPVKFPHLCLSTPAEGAVSVCSVCISNSVSSTVTLLTEARLPSPVAVAQMWEGRSLHDPSNSGPPLGELLGLAL